VFLSSFDHIRNGFYENSGMHDGQIDKEAWMKETAWDDDRRFMSLRRVIENKKILDFGCGNGGFLLKAREVAKHVEGIELESNLKDWFLENRLDIFSRIEDSSGSFDVITIFHVLEHLPDPRTSLVEISAKLDNDGQLVVEVPNACDALISLYQNEPFMRFTYWSCHLYLFNQATLTTLAKQAGLRVNYVRQVQRYSLSNHLHWLAKGTPGGHMKWSFLDSPELHSSYEKQLAAIGACDTIVASLSRT
jgi:2-polyprenyl-3-methyl-5-hydroxy-6-metoxy-1,4-benzoquinol methylase